jgi:hypothetical protein
MDPALRWASTDADSRKLAIRKTDPELRAEKAV